MKKLFTLLTLLVLVAASAFSNTGMPSARMEQEATAVDSAQSTTTYTDELRSVLPSYGIKQVEIENAEADVTNAGDNKYTIVLKTVRIVGTYLGDLTFEGVQGNTYNDGTIGYSFDGNLSVSNAKEGQSDYTNGSTHAATLTGACKEGKLYLHIKTSMKVGSNRDMTVNFELIYGSEITVPTDPDNPSTGISNVNAEINAGKAEIYTIGGARVSSLQRGVNIVRTTDGKVVKILKQ